ncbi:MAG: 5,10-methylenetetrahydromethanopterin reductase [Acidimicrobiaceae bacterium]|nr:5,10-methylenetetrahydromethanopterin reductase [Acidimicrobiaceae bacterium]
MDISCAFATSPSTPEHIALAERLGYTRAWCYDSPALYPDVWMVLALAADRTDRIGLGPAVLVPSLRHPMTNAAAIATLCQLAPGRVAVAIGSGFTGRYVLGQRAMRWVDVAEYVRALRALLRGDDVDWDGGRLRMMHPDGFGPARPVDVPILIGADGPKGLAVAAELGDGVFSAGQPSGGDASGWRAMLTFGTVLDEGESAESERVLLAAGHAAAVAYHALYERRGAAGVDALPGGAGWRQAVEAFPAEERHLAIHEGHLVAANERDQAALAEAPGLAASITFTGTRSELRDRLDQLETAGVTEIAYQPAGPDIPRELDAFMAMARS